MFLTYLAFYGFYDTSVVQGLTFPLSGVDLAFISVTFDLPRLHPQNIV